MSLTTSRGVEQRTAADLGGDSEPAGPPQRVSLGRRLVARRDSLLPLPLYVILGLIILVPLGYLVYAVFQTGSPTDQNSQFTWDNIVGIFTDPIYLHVLGNTLLLAACVTVFSCIIGVTLAWAVARTNLPFKRFFEFFIPMPLFLSPFAGALAWLILGSKNAGFLNYWFKQVFHTESGFMNILSFPGLVFVMVLFHIPFAYLYTVAPLKNMDGALEEASRVGGAGTLRTMVRVTFPMVLPGVLSAAIMVFVLSAEMFTVPALLGAGAKFSTLPTFIYQETQFSPPSWGSAAAAGLVLLLVMIVGILLQGRATRMSNRFVTVTGKGTRPSILQLGRWRWLVAAVPSFFLLCAVFLPMVTLIFVTFLKFVTPRLTAKLFTLDNWANLQNDPVFLKGLGNTIFVALVGSVIATLLAFFLVYAWKRLKAPLARTTETVAMLPVAVPGIVLGVGALWAAVQTPLYGTLWLLIAAYTARFLAYPVRIFSSTLVQVDKSLEEASRVGGAGLFGTLGRVSAPLLTPATLSAWLLLFIMFTRELNIAVMTYSANSIVLPVIMWGSIIAGSLNYAACIALIESVFIIAAYLVARFVFKVDLSSSRA
ncbi:ABC transporter permease [Micromonospora sp. NPDC005161]